MTDPGADGIAAATDQRIGTRLSVLRRALQRGALAILPTDTVYGLVAALDSAEGVARLYALKGRPRSRPCQVLLYAPGLLDDALADLPLPVVAAVRALLPGPATCLVPDRSGRYAAVAGDEPGSVGLRAPAMAPHFAALDLPLVATSANHPGGGDPRTVADVPADLRAGVWQSLDAGPLPGVASAVVDLRPVARGAPARLVRSGPDPSAVTGALAAVGCTLATG